MDAIRDITRRLFLTRAATALPVVATATVPAITATTAAVAGDAENPELLALGDELDAAAAKWAVVVTTYQEARARCEAMVPAVPEELICRGHGGMYAERERDVAGREFRSEKPTPDAIGTYRLIFTADGCRRFLESSDRRYRAYRKMEIRLPIAEKYEAAVQRAKAESGFEDAMEARYWAEHEIDRLGRCIAQTSALTERGLLVKARALAVLGIVDGRIGFQGRLLLGASIAHDFAAEVSHLPHGTSDDPWPSPVFENLGLLERGIITLT